jgi:nitroreductase
MNFLDLAKRRYSSRKFLKQPVEEDKIIKVLEAARIAPSAANKQPVIFYIVCEEENLLKIGEIYHRDWLKESPIVIIACADHNKGWIRSADGKDHCDIDLAIAVDHMTLQATELGLATCWICNFDTVKCRLLFDLPKNIEPIALLPLAYPADYTDFNRHLHQRKPLSDITRWM